MPIADAGLATLVVPSVHDEGHAVVPAQHGATVGSVATITAAPMSESTGICTLGDCFLVIHSPTDSDVVTSPADRANESGA